MTPRVRLVYVEHDLTQPPFVWMNGRALGSDATALRAEVYRSLGHMTGSGSRSAQSGLGRAVRSPDGNYLLVETNLDAVDQDGRRLRVTVAVSGVQPGTEWTDQCTRTVSEALADAGLPSVGRRLSAALEWGWGATSPRFPWLDRALRAVLRAMGISRPAAPFHQT